MITLNKKGDQESRRPFMGKKGAMEMSVGTIVTIVLLMSVLVLGIFLVQKVFDTGTSAIDAIDDEMQSQIQELFSSDSGKEVVLLPNSGEITIKGGDDPKGFGFAIFNRDVLEHRYDWKVEAEPGFDYVTNCGTGMTKARADNYLQIKSSFIELDAGIDNSDTARPVKYNIPETAPPCSIPYILTIKRDNSPFKQLYIQVNIK